MYKKLLTVFIVLIIFILAVGCKKNPQNLSSAEPLNSGTIKVDLESDDNSSEMGDLNSGESEDLTSDNSNSVESSGDSQETSSSNNEDSSKDNISSNGDKNKNPETTSKPVNNSNREETSENENTSNSDDKTTNDKSEDSSNNSESKNENVSSSGDSSTPQNSENQNNPQINTDKTENNNTNNENVDKNENPNNGKPNSGDVTTPNNNQNTNKNPENNNQENTTKPENNQNSENKKEEYELIKCRPNSEITWKKVDLVIGSIKFNVRLSIPDDWNILDNGSIIRNDNVIGKITTKSPGSIINSYEVKSRNTGGDHGNILIQTSIYKSSKNNFNRLFTVSRLGNTDVMVMKKLYLDVKYSELDSESANKIYEQLRFLGLKTQVPKNEINQSKKILILGSNSVSEDYAKIVSFLKTMCETSGKLDYSFEIITKSKSSALSNFAGDEELLSKIKNGEYLYVLQSGFDSSNTSFGIMDDNGYFKKIYDACEKGNSNLILLPSLDDDINVVQTILDVFEKTFILNLKDELNNLVNASVATNKPLSDADIKDADNHLTKYAGFIAAHFIYRNVFGEVPPQINSTELAYTDIQSKFSDEYLNSGIISGEENIFSYYLN